MRDELLYQTRLAAQTIDIEDVRALSGSEKDLKVAGYQNLRSRLSALRETAGCRFVYIMRRRPTHGDEKESEIVFLVDVQDDVLESTPSSQPGDIYADEFVTAEFASLFDGGVPFVEGPVEDEWGVWISALVPLIDHRTGELLAVLGMDHDAKLWRRSLFSDSAPPIAMMMVLLLLLVALLATSRPAETSPRSVAKRLLPSMALVLFLSTSTAVFLLQRAYYDTLDERLNTLHTSISAEFQLDMKESLVLMEAAIESMVESPRLQRAIADADTQALFLDWLSVYGRLYRENGVNGLSFANTERESFLSFSQEDDGERFGEYVALKAERTARVASGVGISSCGNPILLSVSPVFRAGRLVGYVKIRKDIHGILRSRALHSGSNLAITLRKELLNQELWEKKVPESDRKVNWESIPDRVIVLSSMERLPPDIFAPGYQKGLQDALPEQMRKLETVFDEKNWNITVIPFEDASGDSIGEFLILSDTTREKAYLVRQGLLMWSIGGTLAVALLIFLVALLRREDASILAQQAALRESDALLKKLSRQIPGMIYLYRRYPDGSDVIPFVSENIRELCEVEPDDAVRDVSLFFSRVHPESRGTLMEAITHSFETLCVMEIEFRVLLPEKGERWLYGRGNPERLPDGSVLWHGYMADNTERRLKEDEVKRQAGLITSLLKSIPDIIFYKDPEGVFLGCNPPHEELTGRSEAEIVGKTDYDFYDRETADFYREKDVRALSSSHPESNEEWVTYSDGRRALLDTLKTSFRGEDGELIGLLGISRDITERKRMEEDLRNALQAANAANDAKSAFLASMSHEIRTPMNAILGFSQLLERDPELSPGHMKYVQTINRSGEHLLVLINDILDMAKIEADRVTLNNGPFSPYTMLTDIGSLFRTMLDQKSLYLDIEHDDELQSVILVGDEGKLRQVLVNLVGNAVKFTQSGGVTIRFRLEKKSAAESGQNTIIALSVEVEDTGVGISTEQGALIFAPFQQSDAGKRTGGTGLGLAISYKFVEMMGGVLAFESEPSKGSRFYFCVPMERSSEGQEPSSRRAGRVIGLKLGTEKSTLLVVDDDEASRSLLRELLVEAGFEVIEAANGSEAVELVGRRTVDAVLMDMNMPVLDGYEATRKIKAETGGKLPVLAVTADVFAKDAVAACGADAYLRKPFGADELFTVLRDLLHLECAYEEEMLAEDGTSSTITPAPTEVDQIDLSGTPRELLRTLRDSVEEGDILRIRTLIQEMAVEDKRAGEALLLLAERYDYEKLLEVVNGEGGLFDGQ